MPQENGRVYISDGNVEISPGAMLYPIMDEPALAPGQTSRRYDVIVIKSGAPGRITGDYTLLPQATWRYATEKRADDHIMSYYATRRFYPSDLISETNSRNLAVFTKGLAGNEQLLKQLSAANNLEGLLALQAWSAIFLELDNQWDAAGVNATADRMARASTPQATTQWYNLSLRQQRLVTDIFSQELRQGNQLKQSAPYQVTSAGDGLVAGPTENYDFVTWVRPFYHTGKQNAASPAYTDLNQHFGGLSFGGAANLGQLSLGLNLHYIHGQMDGEGYDSDADSFGFMLAGPGPPL